MVPPYGAEGFAIAGLLPLNSPPCSLAVAE